MKRVIFIAILCLSGLAFGQSWSGILAPARAIDWSQAGVVGGIPSATWTQCGSTIAAGASAATVQAAINACGANQYVLLGAGSFTFSTGLIMKSNVVLRGSGSNSTLITVNAATNSCTIAADICFQPASGFSNYYGNAATAPGGTNAATWTSGFSQGGTSIVLSSIGSAGISVGQYILLDQANDTTDNGNAIICDLNSGFICSAQSGSPGRTISAVDHNQIQIVKVTNCSPSCTSGSTFTITPGLYAPNWSSGRTPGAYFGNMIQNSGLENLSMDHSNHGNSAGAAVVFAGAFNCWITNYRSISATFRNHAWIFESGHVTVQNSYFYGSGGASLSYGIESRIGSDDLYINNIFQQVTTPVIIGTSQGDVSAYNYSINDIYTGAITYMDQSNYAHDAGSIYNLFEGNIGNGTRSDAIHGTSYMNTHFRNRYNGWETGKTHQTESVILNSYNRYANIVANILGQSGNGATANYENDSSQQGAGYIYEIGTGDSGDGSTVAADSVVGTTLMRWGNYDTVNAATLECTAASTPIAACAANERGNGAPTYPALASPSTTFPASFWRASQPSWWTGGKPWPPIGPDVGAGNLQQCTSGSYNGYQATAVGQCGGGTIGSAGIAAHANSIPAMDCYLSTMGGPPDGTGSALTFNASTCYATAVASSVTMQGNIIIQGSAVIP